jgi:hypothetical protein
MSTPQGYNPIGQHAPGLPRHDAQLPGHVSGTQFPNIGGGGDEAWQPGANYAGVDFPPWFGLWSGRFALWFAMYLTVPVQIALYPIAGAAALVAGGFAYLLFSAMGSSGALDWAWTGAFFGLLAAMRTEISFEERLPAYRAQRQWLRLGLCFLGMLYFDIHDQGDGFVTALLVSAIFTAIMYFVLKIKILRQIWEGMQIMAWLRKAPDPSLMV